MAGNYPAGSRRLLRVAGVDVLAARGAWLHPLIFLGVGLALGLVLRQGQPPAQIALAGAGYGLLTLALYFAHSAGHILSARLAGAPMDAHLISAVRQVNLYYGDQSTVARWQHFGRAAGGPAANLVIGLAALGGVWMQTGTLNVGPLLAESWLAFVAVASLIVCAAAVCPIPGIDGWVMWRELLGLRRTS